MEFSVEFLQETYLCDKFIPSIWNSVWIVSDIWTSISKSGSNKIIFAPQGVGFVHYPCQVMDSNFQFRLAAGNGENDNKGQILRYLTILVDPKPNSTLVDNSIYVTVSLLHTFSMITHNTE